MFIWLDSPFSFSAFLFAISIVSLYVFVSLLITVDPNNSNDFSMLDVLLLFFY